MRDPSVESSAARARYLPSFGSSARGASSIAAAPAESGISRTTSSDRFGPSGGVTAQTVNGKRLSPVDADPFIGPLFVHQAPALAGVPTLMIEQPKIFASTSGVAVM